LRRFEKFSLDAEKMQKRTEDNVTLLIEGLP